MSTLEVTYKELKDWIRITEKMLYAEDVETISKDFISYRVLKKFVEIFKRKLTVYEEKEARREEKEVKEKV